MPRIATGELYFRELVTQIVKPVAVHQLYDVPEAMALKGLLLSATSEKEYYMKSLYILSLIQDIGITQSQYSMETAQQYIIDCIARAKLTFTNPLPYVKKLVTLVDIPAVYSNSRRIPMVLLPAVAVMLPEYFGEVYTRSGKQYDFSLTYTLNLLGDDGFIQEYQDRRKSVPHVYVNPEMLVRQVMQVKNLQTVLNTMTTLYDLDYGVAQAGGPGSVLQIYTPEAPETVALWAVAHCLVMEMLPFVKGTAANFRQTSRNTQLDGVPLLTLPVFTMEAFPGTFIYGDLINYPDQVTTIVKHQMEEYQRVLLISEQGFICALMFWLSIRTANAKGGRMNVTLGTKFLRALNQLSLQYAKETFIHIIF